MDALFEHSLFQFFWSVLVIMAGIILVKALVAFIPEDRGSFLTAIKKTLLSV